MERPNLGNWIIGVATLAGSFVTTLLATKVTPLKEGLIGYAVIFVLFVVAYFVRRHEYRAWEAKQERKEAEKEQRRLDEKDADAARQRLERHWDRPRDR